MAWRTNPMLLEMALKDALEEAGRGKLLKRLEEETRMRNEMNAALATAPPAQSRPSEMTNPTALEGARELLNETIKRVKKKVRENLVNTANIKDLERIKREE